MHDLTQKPAFFSSAQFVGFSVVNQPGIGTTLQQPVKMVSENGLLFVVCRQSELTPDFERYKGVVTPGGWQYVLVGRNQNDIFEIQHPGFKHPHHLYSFEGFTVERNRTGCRRFPEQGVQCTQFSNIIGLTGKNL
ncbi:hypothetical protein DSECCO2_570730 [anaerobic digester metagenome]